MSVLTLTYQQFYLIQQIDYLLVRNTLEQVLSWMWRAVRNPVSPNLLCFKGTFCMEGQVCVFARVNVLQQEVTSGDKR